MKMKTPLRATLELFRKVGLNFNVEWKVEVSPWLQFCSGRNLP